MINPSAPGWIAKYFTKQKRSDHAEAMGDDLFYQKIRKTGFIYGHIVSFETATPIKSDDWVQNELPKVALLSTLYSIYCKTNSDNNPE
ncbi:MAG: hypothetical protein P8M54_11880, partial [Flavobacterium sp.]|nr:hypothetical protein [Flavobacterium sp.]